MRIRNTTADGVNFMGGVKNSLVVNSHVRNTGDDGLAMYSRNTGLNQSNIFASNTVELPILANGIALYGGQDTALHSNRVIDAGLSQGGGIHIGNRNFPPDTTKPLAGTTSLFNNTIIRSGNVDPNWHHGIGAIWFDARDSAMNSVINVSNLQIVGSLTSAIMFISGNGLRHPITNVSFDDVSVHVPGGGLTPLPLVPTHVLDLRTGGSATFKAVTVSNQNLWRMTPYVSNCSVGFTTTEVGGNLLVVPVNNSNQWLKKPLGCN